MMETSHSCSVLFSGRLLIHANKFDGFGDDTHHSRLVINT